MGHEATHVTGSNTINGLTLANQTFNLQQQTNRISQRDSLSSEQVKFCLINFFYKIKKNV